MLKGVILLFIVTSVIGIKAAEKPISKAPTSKPDIKVGRSSGHGGTGAASKPLNNSAMPVSSKKAPSAACVATAPRLNLNLEMMMGKWFPARMSLNTAKLWALSLLKKYNNDKRSLGDTCILIELNKANSTDVSSLNVTLHNGKHFINVEALLLGDDKHPKASKWAVAWPNGEDTLTSVVAAGVIGKPRGQYNWLLTVDCDINGIIEPDWAVMARVPEGISNATLTAILAIAEGLKGLRFDHAITKQSDDCQK